MPLPSISKYGAKQCAAKSRRTGLPCKNLAAYGCRTCRMHGARKNILIGDLHPNWINGQRSKDWIKQSSEKLSELRYLEDLGHALGMIAGSKTRGRKPRGMGADFTNT